MELAWIILLSLVWLVAVFFFWKNRIWLLYYLVGSVGLAFIIIFLGRYLGFETGLETIVAYITHYTCNLVGIPTEIFQAAPGSLLVMVVGQDIGWTQVQITIECSGLLETGAMLGMILFYPGWSLKRRIWLAAIGVVTVFFANSIRILFIIEILHHMGKNSIFVAHTIGGRALFFVLVVGIYWFVLTRPTLRDVRQKLNKEMAG